MRLTSSSFCMVGLPASGVWRPFTTYTLSTAFLLSLCNCAPKHPSTSSVCRVGPTNVIPVGSSGPSRFLLYNLLGITVTSAPVSILKLTGRLFTWIWTIQGSLFSCVIAPRNFSSSGCGLVVTALIVFLHTLW